MTNDFLRAPLGTTTYTLAAAWAGRPHWFFHHLALGETLGYCTRLSQNNSGLYRPTQFTRQVHIALMGDPTLRMHVVLPPSGLTASVTNGSVTVTWNASADANVVGYHVYRATSAGGPFTRLTGSSPLTVRSFTDSPSTGSYTYMVRAIKLETSPSGSYYNASQGIFASATLSSTPNTPVNISNVRISGSWIAFRCTGQLNQRFCIERTDGNSSWSPVLTNTFSTTTTFDFSEVLASGRRFYRTRTLP